MDTAFRMLGGMQENVHEWASAAILFMLVPRFCAADRWSAFLQAQWRQFSLHCASLARLLHSPSELSLQPAVGCATMTGTHVYGQKARLANSVFKSVLWAFGDHVQLPGLG